MKKQKDPTTNQNLIPKQCPESFNYEIQYNTKIPYLHPARSSLCIYKCGECGKPYLLDFERDECMFRCMKGKHHE